MSVSAALPLIARAVASISVEAEASTETVPPISASNVPNSVSSRLARSASRSRAASFSSDRFLADRMVSRNTCTAPAIAPISSRRPTDGIVVSSSPAASSRIARVIATSGTAIPWVSRTPARRPSIVVTPSAIWIRVRPLLPRSVL